MLLQLCGDVAIGDTGGSAPFRPERHPVARDPALREQGYPAYLLAEAFAQIACRTARAGDPRDRRVLPVRITGLVADHPIPSDQAHTLEARPLRSQPLAEFACRLVDPCGHPLASATVTVAPAESTP